MTKKQKELISRIEAMEARYQEVKRVLGELDNNLSILRDYMESGQNPLHHTAKHFQYHPYY